MWGTLSLVKDIAINPGPFTGALGSLDSGSLGCGSLDFSVSEAPAGLVVFVNDIEMNPGPFEVAGSFVTPFSGLCSSRCVCAILAGFFGGVGFGFLSFDSPIRCPVFICCSRSRKDLYLVAGLVPNDVLLNVFLVASASLVLFVFNLQSSLTTFVSSAPYCGLFSAFNVGFDAFGFIGGSRFRMTGVTKFTSKGDWLLLGKGGASSSSFWFLLLGSFGGFGGAC